MGNPNTIIVDGQIIKISGSVEFEGGILSVPPKDRGTRKLLKGLQPRVEGQTETHEVIFRGERLTNFAVLIRAPRNQPTEG